ncbi:hypothetical protein [Marinithermus hydrothermalis]|uniref:hypothetical protein n=1 Tax=Marinithermus hydrothermalis TaxID=186192 RepID=UPI00030F2922|nr:hypothetical protein [Marinithermus hydrothermalis]
MYRGKTLLLATGVARYHPTVDGDWRPCLAYAGKCNVYYCPDCKAPEIEGKATLVVGVGSSRGAVGTARHLLAHAPKRLALLLTGERALAEPHQEWAQTHGVPVYAGEIRALVGRKACLETSGGPCGGERTCTILGSSRFPTGSC